MSATKIHGGKQIQDATIADAQIASDAAIALSKLSEAVLQADGGQAMTGNLPAGGHKVTGLGAPSASTDAATKGYVDGVAQGLNIKQSVRVATTQAQTLASDFVNGDTIDGVVLATGDRVLVKDQADASENGIYVVAASGAPARADDASTGAEVKSMFTFVEEGTTNGDTGWVCTTNGTITLDTTDLAFTQFSSAGSIPVFVDMETPSGTINGSNTAFSLAYTPVSGSVHLHLNGVLLEAGGSNDYTISGVNITMLTAPESGSKLRASYRR